MISTDPRSVVTGIEFDVASLSMSEEAMKVRVPTWAAFLIFAVVAALFFFAAWHLPTPE